MAGFIAAQRAQYGVPHATSCRALGVSQAWFYKWVRGDVSLRHKRRAAVDAAVAYEFARRQGPDGSPPVAVRLRDAGWRISKNTVADSMRRQGWVARPKRKRRGLTKADRRARKPADLLARDFAPPARINQRWVSDINYPGAPRRITPCPHPGGKLNRDAFGASVPHECRGPAAQN